MKVHVLLADKGQQDPTGKLHLLGLGWSLTGILPTGATPDAVVVALVEAPWDRCNRPMQFVLELLNADGSAVLLPSPAGPQPLRAEQTMIAVPPQGAPNGTPGAAQFLIEISGGLPLAPGQRYLWRATIDGETDEAWETGFFVARSAQPPRFGADPAAPGPIG